MQIHYLKNIQSDMRFSDIQPDKMLHSKWQLEL